MGLIMKKGTNKDIGIDTVGGLGPLSAEEEKGLREYFEKKKQDRQAAIAKKKSA